MRACNARSRSFEDSHLPGLEKPCTITRIQAVFMQLRNVSNTDTENPGRMYIEGVYVTTLITDRILAYLIENTSIDAHRRLLRG